MSATVYVSRRRAAKPGLILPQEPGTGQRTGFRPDIEGLRAVAVLSVVLYHAGVRPLTGGYVGVDVFFVISGFLITNRLFSELLVHRTLSVARFYARRITRLLPTASLVLVATLLGAWLWLPSIRLSAICLDALTSAFAGMNWRAATAGGAGAGGAASPLWQFWSLAVGEQFFLVWPALLFVASLAWRWRRPSLSRVSVVVTLLAIGAGSLFLSVTQTRDAARLAYTGTHTRAWELAVGALLAIAASAIGRLRAPVAAALTWLGLAAIVVSDVVFSDATEFPGYAAALPVLGAAAVVGGGCAEPRSGAASLLRLPPLRWLGTLSYSWYLWHWPILTIVPVALGRAPSTGLNLVLVGGALLVAAGSHVLVERRVRLRLGARTRPRRELALGLSLSVVVATAAVLVGWTARDAVADDAPDTRAVVAAAHDPAATLAGLIARGVSAPAVPGNLRPAPARAAQDLPAVYPAGCHLDVPSVTSPDTCVFGDPAGSSTMVLFGDGQAAQWFPALDQIAKRRHWRLVSYTKSACPVAAVLVARGDPGQPYTECSRWRDRTLAEIRTMRPEMVVMAGADDGVLVDASGDADHTWTWGWVTSLDKVRQPGTKLVVLQDTPHPKGDVPRCVSAHRTEVTQCVQPVEQAFPDPERRAMVAAAVSGTKATVIDPTPWFCAPAGCPVMVGDLLVYRDESHMSSAYAAMLAPVLARSLP